MARRAPTARTSAWTNSAASRGSAKASSTFCMNPSRRSMTNCVARITGVISLREALVCHRTFRFRRFDASTQERLAQQPADHGQLTRVKRLVPVAMGDAAPLVLVMRMRLAIAAESRLGQQRVAQTANRRTRLRVHITHHIEHGLKGW